MMSFLTYITGFIMNFELLSPLFSIFSLVTILVGSRDHLTQFWKGAIQGSFHKSLAAIGPVVSEEKKIVSGISEHRPRWPPQPNLI
jgi:hypothetical protein